MALEGSTLLLCAVIVVPLGLLLGWRMRVNQRARRRRAEWLDLCRRLELRPREGRPEVASGRQHGAELELREPGSVLFLGLRLSEPLLPPGVLLLSWQREWLLWLTGAAHLLGLVIAGSQRSRKDLHYLVVLIFPAVFTCSGCWRRSCSGEERSGDALPPEAPQRETRSTTAVMLSRPPAS